MRRILLGLMMGAVAVGAVAVLVMAFLEGGIHTGYWIIFGIALIVSYLITDYWRQTRESKQEAA